MNRAQWKVGGAQEQGGAQGVTWRLQLSEAENRLLRGKEWSSPFPWVILWQFRDDPFCFCLWSNSVSWEVKQLKTVMLSDSPACRYMYTRVPLHLYAHTTDEDAVESD